MEPLLFSVCVIVLTLLFFFSACSSQAKSHGKRNGKLKLPPGSLGWPFIGETYDFLFSDPHQFIKLRMQKYSPKIFKTHLYGQPTAVLCGTSGHKFIAANEEKLMTAWRTAAMQKLFRGKDRTNSSDGATISRRSEKHVIRAPVLIGQEALVAYASIIDGMTKKHFERKWFGKSEVEVYGLIELLTVGIATKLFIGLESDVERLAKMAKWFGHIAHGLNVLPYDIPGTKFGRAMKSAKAVKHEILKVMEEKRERICKGEKPSDILSFLMVSADPSGKVKSDNEVAGMVMGLITAAFNSASVALTFAMKYLGQYPQVYQRIRDEQMEIARSKKAGESLTWNDMQRMKYSWNVLLEVMRLVPPLQGTFRVATTDITYEGFTIPEGWKIYWTVSSTNNDPEIFREPEKFDPTRFESEIQPFLNVPFGGGPRICPGKDFAKLQMLIYLHYAVTFFKWELINNVNTPKVPASMHPLPSEGFRVRLERCSQ